MYGQPSGLIELVQRGMASQQAGMLDAAEALYRQALAIDANQFEAIHFLGVLQAQRGNLLEAERLVSKSLKLHAQRAEAHLNHARILRDLQRPDATVESCNRALRLNPGLVAASVLLGNALRDLACYDAALEAYERAIALRPGYHDAIYNRAILQLGKGQFEQGWAGFEHRFEISEQTVRRPALPGRIWAGEPLSSKSIVVHGEQGYGDIIMTSRYLSQLSKAGAHVTFFVVPELLRLLRTLSPPIELAARIDSGPARALRPSFPISLLKQSSSRAGGRASGTTGSRWGFAGRENLTARPTGAARSRSPSSHHSRKFQASG
jgi:Tfp pilus assembly protein PilF